MNGTRLAMFLEELGNTQDAVRRTLTNLGCYGTEGSDVRHCPVARYLSRLMQCPVEVGTKAAWTVSKSAYADLPYPVRQEAWDYSMHRGAPYSPLYAPNIRAQIFQTLQGLGDSVARIARSLHAVGIRVASDYRDICRECPLALYLNAKLEETYVVGMSKASRTVDPDRLTEILMPPACNEFVQAHLNVLMR